MGLQHTLFSVLLLSVLLGSPARAKFGHLDKNMTVWVSESPETTLDYKV